MDATSLPPLPSGPEPLDPAGLVTLLPGIPDVRGVVALELLDGFVDAGSAVSIVRTHLLQGESTLLARFDVDRLYDYRARRPLMVFDEDRWKSYEAPTLGLHLLHDDGGSPYVVLAGPEPDVMWEAFATAVGHLVERLGLRLVVGLSAFPMSVPHTRPVGIVSYGHGVEGVSSGLGRIVVPASAGNHLHFRLGEQGHPVLGLAATVPPYLTQSTYPQAALALLREVNTRTGLLLPVDPIVEAAEETARAVDEQVARSEDVQQVVRALEEQYDVRTDLSSDGTPTSPLPSADELGAELERFLAEQSGPDEGQGRTPGS